MIQNNISTYPAPKALAALPTPPSCKYRGCEATGSRWRHPFHASLLGRPAGAVLVCLLVIALLSSCQQTEDIPTADGKQTTYLQMGITEVSTYAGTEGSDAENKIESVAFFVVTAGGEFSKYLSSEPLNSEYGLSSALSGSPGSYKVSATFKARDFSGTTAIYVIANYAQNGLTAKLTAVKSMSDLQKLQSNALTENGAGPQYPLLMYTKESLKLTAGSTTATSLYMQRMVARIEVTDHRQDAAKFKLISVQVFNPKSKTYLLPSADNPAADIASVPQLSKWAHITTDKSISLYSNETAGTETKLLMVQVVYEYEGTGQISDFVFKDKDGKGIRIERNKRYSIHFSLKNGKLSFATPADDVEEGGEI